MAKRKYEHLIKPLNIATIPQMMRDGAGFRNTGNADSIYWLNGKEHLEGLPLNFSWGFYTGLGDWHPGMDPHIHPYPEALIWVGLDADNVAYLGAKTSYCLGEELEVHTFDKPSVVIVPAGVPHCPSITQDVTNPIGYSFMIFSLGAEPTTTWMGDGVAARQAEPRRPAPAGSGRGPLMVSSYSEKKIKVTPETLTYGHKYDHLVKPLKPFSTSPERLTPEERAQYEKLTSDGMKVGPGNADNLVWMYGKDLEGLELNFTWGFHKSRGWYSLRGWRWQQG